MEVQNIRIDLISPSPLNPRKTFDEAALEELASNIEKQGLAAYHRQGSQIRRFY